MTTFTNRYGMAGKVIAGVESDTERPVAYIVLDSDTSAPALRNIAEYLQRFNGQRIRITIEHDIERPAAEAAPACDRCGALPGSRHDRYCMRPMFPRRAS